MVFVTLCSFVNAQTFYVKAGGGYSFSLSPYSMGVNSKDIFWRERDLQTGNFVPAIIKESREVKGSYSAGFNASATVGYNLTDIIGVEIGASYIHGKEYKTSDLAQDITSDAGVITIDNSSLSTSKSAATVILVSPSFRLTAPGGFLQPYLAAGPVLGFAKLENEYEAHSDYDGEQKEVRHEKYSGGLSIGMRGAVGVDIRLSETLALFSELTFNSINYFPKEKEITKYEVNDVNRLPDLTERERRTVYVKNVATDTRDENYNDPDEPAKANRVSFAMNSLVANVGIKLTL